MYIYTQRTYSISKRKATTGRFTIEYDFLYTVWLTSQRVELEDGGHGGLLLGL